MMAHYYVFQTRAQAQAAVDGIDARARAICRIQGHQIKTATGAVIGQRASEGAPMPDVAKVLIRDPRQPPQRTQPLPAASGWLSFA